MKLVRLINNISMAIFMGAYVCWMLGVVNILPFWEILGIIWAFALVTSTGLKIFDLCKSWEVNT